MVKNGKVGKIIEADDDKWIKLTEQLYKVRQSWDNIHLYKYEEVVPEENPAIQKIIQRREKRKKPGIDKYIDRM